MIKTSIIILALLLSVTGWAQAKGVTHSHAGRVHSHPLPKEGIKHRHGSGAIGLAVSSGNTGGSLQEIKLLADRGDAQAQNKLGVLYEEGNGVRKNPEAAAKWYQKAAVNESTQTVEVLFVFNGKREITDFLEGIH